MGDSSFHDAQSPLYLQRVRFTDGDYGPDSTYWGGGFGVEALWCAFNGPKDPQADTANGSRIYVRASNRQEAAEKVLEEFPTVIFFRFARKP